MIISLLSAHPPKKKKEFSLLECSSPIFLMCINCRNKESLMATDTRPDFRNFFRAKRTNGKVNIEENTTR